MDVYTSQGSTRTHTHIPGSQSVTGCLNEQGNSVGGYLNNPNCRPATS